LDITSLRARSNIFKGTPHTYHYINALDAIRAKKHVLCEKPVTSNVAELRALLAAAKENGVFFMEAMWTRFQPLPQAVIKLLNSGELGAPVVVHADLSGNFDIQSTCLPVDYRLYRPDTSFYRYSQDAQNPRSGSRGWRYIGSVSL
jgi:predicted dehydrogenase